MQCHLLVPQAAKCYKMLQICLNLEKQGWVHDQQMRLLLGRGSKGICSPFPGLSQHSDHFKQHDSTVFENMAQQTYEQMDGPTDGWTPTYRAG